VKKDRSHVDRSLVSLLIILIKFIPSSHNSTQHSHVVNMFQLLLLEMVNQVIKRVDCCIKRGVNTFICLRNVAEGFKKGMNILKLLLMC
jgi:hypothetical protein